MSSDGDSKKSGLNYVLLIGVLLIVSLSLFTVPFTTIGLAIKKSGLLGQHAANDAAALEKNSPGDHSHDIDFAGLRASVEKVAATMIKDPNLKTITEFVKIESPAEKIQKTKITVGEMLENGHHQFVEAVDPDQIRIIVILKSKEWPALAAQLMDAADMEGFVYKGPSNTSTAGDADTVIAEIEIARKK
jgi:hypothetical protein